MFISSVRPLNARVMSDNVIHERYQETFCSHDSMDETISVRCADQHKCILHMIRQSYYPADNTITRNIQTMTTVWLEQPQWKLDLQSGKKMHWSCVDCRRHRQRHTCTHVRSQCVLAFASLLKRIKSVSFLVSLAGLVSRRRYGHPVTGSRMK